MVAQPLRERKYFRYNQPTMMKFMKPSLGGLADKNNS